MSKDTSQRSESATDMVVTEHDQVVVGLDVHKRMIAAAIRVNGREVNSLSLPADAHGVLRVIAPYRAGRCRVVFEAGPTGYALARSLARAGVSATVVSPAQTPRPARIEAKSDRLDCRRLAQFAEQGLLRPVAVPSDQEDHDRQVVRLRDQLLRKRRRTKQQIRSFLLYHGLSEPTGLTGWSKACLQALRVMRIPELVRFSLDILLDELAHLEELFRRVEQQLVLLARQPRHAVAVEHLMSHPGVGRTTAMTFLTEVYRPERFTREGQLAKYVGLAPLIRQSGNTRREGALIKAGREHLRSLLVEAAWVWIRRDASAVEVYRRLVHNTGSSQKAIIGMARRLAIRLWIMLLRQEDYRQTT